MHNRRNAERAHRGKEDRAVERADFQQEFWQQPEVVHHLEHPDHELKDHARNQRQKLRRLVKIACVGRFLDARDLFVHLPVDFLHRVGLRQVQLHRALGGIGRHLLFDHHAELDVFSAAVDLLPGQKAVERRILCHRAHIRRQKYMRDAEARQPRAPLLADVALHGGNLDRVAHEVGSADSRRHDIVCNHLHGIQRAKLAPVDAVAPRGVVFAVRVRLHCQHREKSARQKQKLRQKAHARRPVGAGKRTSVRVGKHADPRGKQQYQRPVVAHAPGNGHRVKARNRQIRHPEHKAQAQTG